MTADSVTRLYLVENVMFLFVHDKSESNGLFRMSLLLYYDRWLRILSPFGRYKDIKTIDLSACYFPINIAPEIFIFC